MIDPKTRYKIFLSCGVIVFFISCVYSYAMDEKPESVSAEANNPCARIEFTLPAEIGESSYLGLGLDKPIFSVSEIKADVVIIEVVTAYCPYCEGKISSLNEVYELVKNSPYADKIKIIGVGMSNTERELKTFKDKYSVPFPLFADPENKMYTALGRVSMPHWVVLKSDQNGKMKEIYSASKELPEPKVFLDMILEKSKI